jgi:NhaP-type Na+/H+ or K+/H+ antiporter
LGLKPTQQRLRCFVTGLALAGGCRWQRLRAQRQVQDAVNDLSIAAMLLLFGTIAPSSHWMSLGLPGIALVAGVMALWRLPWVMLLGPVVPAIHGAREAALVGWFGPIGVGAIFYAAMVQRTEGQDEAFAVASLLEAVSVVAFAVATSPLVRHHAAR